MKEQDLVAKRDAIQAAFDEQAKIKSEAETEQYRLQGEYRLVQQLIDNLPSKKSKDGENK